MIPTLNDDPEETRNSREWILENLGPDVPLHFTAFHPDFKLQDKPPTPPETLHRARKIALDAGLHYVYEGNIFSDAAYTRCPGCDKLLIRRSWHNVLENNLKNGACPKCGLAIPGVWQRKYVDPIRKPRQAQRLVIVSITSTLVGPYRVKSSSAMELLEGQTLKHRISGKPHRQSRNCWTLGIQIADGWKPPRQRHRASRHQARQYFSGESRARRKFWILAWRSWLRVAQPAADSLSEVSMRTQTQWWTTPTFSPVREAR